MSPVMILRDTPMFTSGKKIPQEDENWEAGFGTLMPRVLRRNPFVLPPEPFFMVLLREELMRFEQNQEEGDHLYRSSLGLDRANVSLLSLSCTMRKKLTDKYLGSSTSSKSGELSKKCGTKMKASTGSNGSSKQNYPPEKLTEVKEQIKRRAPELEENMEEEDA